MSELTRQLKVGLLGKKLLLASQRVNIVHSRQLMGTGDYAFRRNSAARTFAKTVFAPEEDWKIGKATTAAAQEGARGGREVVTDACATSSEWQKFTMFG